MHKSQKSFQLEVSQGNNELKLNYCSFIFGLPPIRWIQKEGGGRSLGVNTTEA